MSPRRHAARPRQPSDLLVPDHEHPPKFPRRVQGGRGRHIRSERIRTVINLRGPNAGRDWYDDEVAACEQMGVRHIDVRMSARELPPPAEAAALMSALHNAAKPILVHCNGGADRSGLACAAYLIAEHGADSLAAASGQLSLWYGHLPVGKSQETNHFFTMYNASPGIPLRAWVNSEYPSLYEAQRAVRAMPPIANAPFWQVALAGLIAAGLMLWRAARVGRAGVFRGRPRSNQDQTTIAA